MNFDRSENGYSPEQVEKYISESYKLYTDTIKRQKDLIAKLEKENKSLLKKVSRLTKDREQIADAVRVAMEKTNELNRMYASKVQSELNTLRTFRNKWNNYYRELTAKYPVDSKIEKAGEIDVAAGKIVDSYGSENEEKDLFDYEQAIHPTESLADILQTFGLGPDEHGKSEK